MAHWARIITEDDAPEWVGVHHKDGTLSEVKVAVFNDDIHLHVRAPGGVKVHLHDGFADR